jgi:4-hydroxy-2-oxoheptanedioate aldolase
VAELFAREGYGAIVLDVQHGLFDEAACEAVIARCALLGTPVLVRTPVENFAMAAHLLDFGAAGIIAPMINSAADAARFVSFVKYLPLGERSWGAQRAIALSGLSGPEYLAQANRLTLAIAMIETREGVAAVEDILAVPGVDGLFLGPGDLSIALSNGASLDPAGKAVRDVYADVLPRARAAGKFCGAFGLTPADAKGLALDGFQVVTAVSDTYAIRDAARAALAAAEGR